MVAIRAIAFIVSLAMLVSCAPSATPTAAPTSTSAPAPTVPPKPAGVPTPTAAPAKPVATEKVTLVLDWFPNTNHTGLYVAGAKGWFADEGIEIEIQQPSDPSASMKLVGANNAEFGISYQPAVEIARAQDVPVVSIAALLQHNTAAYTAKSAKSVKRPKDFEGRKFGTSGLAQIEPTLRTVMACDNGDFTKVEMVNVGQRLSPSLLADQVDVISMLPAWEGVDLELKGNKLDFLPQRDWCVPDLYTIVFISSEKTLAAKPEVARRFLSAVAKGYEYAAANPVEAAEILMKAAPDLDRELVKRSQAILSTQYKADAPRWGVQTAERWQKHAEWMLQNKLIAKPIDIARAFTNDYLPKS
ncbi:MAG: ABC transporter substrate-binding protein [Chloroflexota bacterium]|nr:MAG: ABC transporter substrate-binding protein [Chloroflexota bacterium]